MKRKNIYIAATLVIAFILLIAYASGYRISGFMIVKTGQLEIHVPYKNSSITIDSKHAGLTHEDNEIFVLKNLRPGTHTVLISEGERYPWITRVNTPYNTVQKIYPFNIKISSNSTIVETTDPTYATKVKEIRATTLPTSSNPVFSDDKTIGAYVDGDSIKAEWQSTADSAPALFCENTTCTRTIEIAPLAKEIYGLTFYPGRNDVIILATEGGIYALEIASHDNQNFQPIVLGQTPRMQLDGNTLFVLEKNTLGIVIIE